MTAPPVGHVYTAIAAVSNALSKEGISKGRKNKEQGYAFRGIDDILNSLSSLLAEHQLCIIPHVIERICDERKSQKGTALFYVTVKVQFDIISAKDGSRHEAITYGEAMDTGDKATNKSMSAAYKYMALLLFCIPTEGDNDADATTHTVTPKEPLATDDQVRQLQDYSVAEGLTPAYRKRLAQLLSAQRRSQLTAAKATQALTALKGAA